MRGLSGSSPNRVTLRNQMRDFLKLFCTGICGALLIAKPVWAQVLNPIESYKEPTTHPPRFQKAIPKQLESCLQDKANLGIEYWEQPAQFQRICPEAEFIEKISKFRSVYGRKENPAIALVVSGVIVNEIKLLSANLFQKQAPGEFPLSEGILFSKPQGFWREAEKEFWQTTEPYVVEARNWLEPLLIESRNRKDQPLGTEAAWALMEIYGESFRFENLIDHLKANASLLGDYRKSTSMNLLTQTTLWIEKFFPPPSTLAVSGLDPETPTPAPIKNWPLLNWTLERLIANRNSDFKNNGSEDDFFLWSQSLFFEFLRDAGVRDRNAVLGRLRELWIAFPNDPYPQKIRALSQKLGLASAFKAPMLRDLNLDEIITRARAQVRALDSLAALRTMKRVRLLNPRDMSDDDLWGALIYHIRVLRLLDERGQISSIIKSYFSMRNFLLPPEGDKKNKPSTAEIQKYLSRLHELSRLYWNYDDPQKALEIIVKILDANKKYGVNFFQGQALVIRARIKEQSKEIKGALELADQALQAKIPQDLTEDLLWRKVYLKIDDVQQSTRSPATDTAELSLLLSYLEPLRKISERDAGEKTRWLYWTARIHQILGEKKKAVEFYKKAYVTDPYSYYSNIAGLRLKNEFEETPDDWQVLKVPLDVRVPAGTRKWETPNWDLFVQSNGRARDPVYRAFARVYVLGSLGKFEDARAAFGDLDRSLWQIVLSSRIPWTKRREFSRSVSWMRRALGDPVGALRAAEVARQANVKDLEESDFLNLYPLPYWDIIQTESKKQGLDPWLTASLIRQESAFDSQAKSWANAIGLMQIIPPVAEQEARLMDWKNFRTELLFEPPNAVKLGSHHLGRLVRQFENSWVTSIAAYNAGSPPVVKWLNSYSKDHPDTFVERIPFLETRNYVKSILRNFMNYQRIYSDGKSLNLEMILRMPERVPPVTGF